MWLSKQMQRRAADQPVLEQTGVQTAQEQITDLRAEQLTLAAPGGFAWRPKVGDQLLVYKDIALGSRQSCPVTLAPGECCLYAGGAYIRLTEDGVIELSGRLRINGVLQGEGEA